VGLLHSASAITLSSSWPRTSLWSRPLLPPMT